MTCGGSSDRRKEKSAAWYCLWGVIARSAGTQGDRAAPVLAHPTHSEGIARSNQGIPVLPQRAASEGQEQGAARLPFVLAEPPQ